MLIVTIVVVVILLTTITVVFLKSFKFQWSISIINVFEYIVGCIGKFHLFDSEAQNQIAGIKKMLKLISSAELWWFE